MASTDLSERLATHRMLASCDGMFVAMVIDIDHETVRIEHNIPGISFPRFCLLSQGRHIETRILEVCADRLLFWGQPIGSLTCGVYELTRKHAKPRLVDKLSALECLGRSGVCLCENALADSAYEKIWSSSESVTGDDVDSRSVLGGALYLDFDELPIDLVRVQSLLVLVSRSQFRSRLRIVNADIQLTFPLKEVWRGEIECLWVSPSERSLAWLVRPDANSPNRELYVNGELVHKGMFLLNQQDLVWAQSGSKLGVLITNIETNRQSIFTTHQHVEIPDGTFVREFLVDEGGNVAATVEDNGELCTPRIYTRPFESVPLAWNLRWTKEGSISFNSVLGSTVCRTIDSTNLLRH